MAKVETYGGKGSAGPSLFNKGWQKGLQQYFTPPEIAEYIAEAFSFVDRNVLILDPTCGDGALLYPFTLRGYPTLGVEIDSEMARKAWREARATHVITADWNQVAYQLCLKLCSRSVKFVMVSNPPYGLRFQAWGMQNKPMQSDLAIGEWFLDTAGYGNTFACFFVPKDSLLVKEFQKNIRIRALIDVDDPWGIESHNKELVLMFTDGMMDNRHPLTGHIKDTPPDKVREWLKGYRDLTIYQGVPGAGLITQIKEEVKEAYVPRWLYEDKTLKLRGSRLLMEKKLRGSYRNYENLVPDLEKGIELARLGLASGMIRQIKEFAEELELPLPDEFLTDMVEAQKTYMASAAPLQPLATHQKMAYGIEAIALRCVGDGEIDGHKFIAGKCYDVVRGGTMRKTTPVETYITETEDGKQQRREIWHTYTASYIVLRDENGEEVAFWDDDKEKLEFLVGDGKGTEGHFEFPYPGEAEKNEPDKYAQNLRKLEQFPFPKGEQLLRFQKEDIARLALRDQAILSWDTGLGKTRAMILWAWLKGAEKVLIVSPARSIKNLSAEIDKGLGLGKKVRIIKTDDDIDNAAKAEKGIFLITYDRLSEYEMVKYTPDFKEGVIKVVIKRDRTPTEEKWPIEWGVYHEDRYGNTYEDWIFETADGQLVGEYDIRKWCREKSREIYPVAEKLNGNFQAIILDEGHYIKGDQSKRAKAILTLNAPYRLIATATTIKNRIPDLFNLLYWLFKGNPAFPYDLDQRQEFIRDFALIKHTRTWTSGNTYGASAKDYQKVIGVRNLSVLWKMLTPFQIRRTKEKLLKDYPEDYRRINGGKEMHLDIQVFSWPVPQDWADMYLRLRDEFLTAFAIKKQNPRVLNGMMMAGGQDILGRLILIQQFCSFAGSDNLDYMRDWVPNSDNEDNEEGEIKEKKKFTEEEIAQIRANCDWRYKGDHLALPKVRAVLASIIRAINRGERVVLFSQFYATQDFYKETLSKLGLRVAMINGRQSKEQNETARIDFAAGKYDVMVAATGAAGLGLNGLERASLAIFVDLMWDPTTLRQAIGRIYRIGQSRPPRVEIHLTEGTTEAHIWNIVYEKGKDVDMVIDGELTEFTIEKEGVIQRVAERTNETCPRVEDLVVEIPELSLLRPLTMENVVIEPEPEEPKPEPQPQHEKPIGPSLWGDGLVNTGKRRVRVVQLSLFPA